jgi:hypothetical protein
VEGCSASPEAWPNQTGNDFDSSVQIFGLYLLQVNRDFQVEQHDVLVFLGTSLPCEVAECRLISGQYRGVNGYRRRSIHEIDYC